MESKIENAHSFEFVLRTEYPYVAEFNEENHPLCVWGHGETCGDKYTGIVCYLRDDHFLPTHYMVRNGRTTLLMRVKTYPCEEWHEHFYTEHEWDDEDNAAIRWENGKTFGVEDGDQFFALPELAIEKMR